MRKDAASPPTPPTPPTPPALPALPCRVRGTQQPDAAGHADRRPVLAGTAGRAGGVDRGDVQRLVGHVASHDARRIAAPLDGNRPPAGGRTPVHVRGGW